MTRASPLADPVYEAARRHAPDLYLSGLLAPRALRADHVTLAAYHGETARIPLVVREGPLAEIRLQWWREAIVSTGADTRTGSPNTDALVDLIRRRPFLRELVLAPLDAHDHLLSRSSLTEAAELGTYLDAVAGSPLRAAAHLVDVPDDDETNAIIAAAGQAYGRARLALELPYHLANGRWPVPAAMSAGYDPRYVDEDLAREAVMQAIRTLHAEARAHLAEIERHKRGVNPQLVRALRPVALVQPYFAALEAPGRDALRQPADIAPVVRAARLWLAGWLGLV